MEFDSRRIITGSRDKKIKVWSLQTGKLLGTFKGAHTGSVLCLKFEKDWDREWASDDEEGPLAKGEPRLARTGFMVSGSSDCTVCVWDLHLGPLMESDDVSISSDCDRLAERDEGERQILAEVRATLRGHSLGVLDIRIDKRWIVSWCVLTCWFSRLSTYLTPIVRKTRSFVSGTGKPWNCIVFCEDTRAQSMLLGSRMVVWYGVQPSFTYSSYEFFPGQRQW